jgi:hypothetical protein
MLSYMEIGPNKLPNQWFFSCTTNAVIYSDVSFALHGVYIAAHTPHMLDMKTHPMGERMYNVVITNLSRNEVVKDYRKTPYQGFSNGTWSSLSNRIITVKENEECVKDRQWKQHAKNLNGQGQTLVIIQSQAPIHFSIWVSNPLICW